MGRRIPWTWLQTATEEEKANFWNERNAQVKFKHYNKQRIAMHVADPFTMLADEIGKAGRTEAAREVFKQMFEPQFEELKKAAPDLYKRLDRGRYLCLERGEKLDLGREYPTMRNLISNHASTWGDDADLKKYPYVITDLLITANLTGEHKEMAQKATELRSKAEFAKRELELFLKPFELVEQVPFSFPQLTSFLEEEFHRPIRCQKRPRLYAVPSDELKSIVTQALVLRDAKKGGQS